MVSAEVVDNFIQQNPIWFAAAVGVFVLCLVYVLSRLNFIQRRLPKVLLSFDSMVPSFDRWSHISSNDTLGVKVVPVYLGWRKAVIINEPAAVKEVSVEKRDDFYKISDVEPLLGPALGQGLLVSEGSTWKVHRHAASFVFHQDFKKFHADAVRKVAIKLVDHFKQHAERGQELELFDTLDLFATKVMGNFCFGYELPDEIHKHLFLMFHELEWQCKLFIRYHTYKPSFKNTMKILDDWIYERIKEKRAEIARDGAEAHVPQKFILTQLCLATELSDQEVRDELITFMFAGHDGVALSSSHAIYLMSKPENSETVSKIRAEAAEVYGNEEFPSYDDVEHKLTYTEWCFKEALRLYPPVPVFGRRAIRDTSILGVPVPKDASVLIYVRSIHRRPDLYPEPLKFNPDRWSGPPKTANEFMPFAVMPRSCIGRIFAYFEAKYFISTLESHFTMKASRPQGRYTYGLTLHPQDGLWVVPSINPVVASTTSSSTSSSTSSTTATQ